MASPYVPELAAGLCRRVTRACSRRAGRLLARRSAPDEAGALWRQDAPPRLRRRVPLLPAAEVRATSASVTTGASGCQPARSLLAFGRSLHAPLINAPQVASLPREQRGHRSHGPFLPLDGCALCRCRCRTVCPAEHPACTCPSHFIARECTAYAFKLESGHKACVSGLKRIFVKPAVVTRP